MNRQWYGALPAWLHPQQQQQQLQRGSMQGQQDGEAALVAPLLGLQLQQHFPLLRPLQRYRDTAAGAVSPLPQQQQPETPGMQQECCPAVKFKGAGRVSDVVRGLLGARVGVWCKAPLTHDPCGTLGICLHAATPSVNTWHLPARVYPDCRCQQHPYLTACVSSTHFPAQLPQEGPHSHSLTHLLTPSITLAHPPHTPAWCCRCLTCL
jgi:hypothetical protein